MFLYSYRILVVFESREKSTDGEEINSDNLKEKNSTR